jgi:hypothetical protein
MKILKEKREAITKARAELTEEICPAYQNIESDARNKMSQLEKKCEDLSTVITNHGEDWHREIDKLVQKLKDEVEEMKTTQLHTLQKSLDEVSRKISGIKEDINSFDVALVSNSTFKVFSVMSNVDKYERPPQKIMFLEPNFTPRKIQEEELCKLFGTLLSISEVPVEQVYSAKTGHKAPKAPVIKQLLDEPKVIATINVGYQRLVNIACLNDEKFWTLGNYFLIKLIHINDTSFLKYITTKSENIPRDIAVTMDGDLV